jgi:hypothetical protein
MTVSTTVSSTMTVDELVLLAYQQSGLVSIEQGSSVPGWTAKAAHGRRLLGMVLQKLSIIGAQARFVSFENVTMEVGVSSYTLDAGIFDLLDTAMYVPEGEDVDAPSTETAMRKLTREQWQTLGSKSSESDRPTLYYVNRSGTGFQVELRIWPIPSEAGTVRLQALRPAMSTADGNAQIDIQPHWHLALLWSLADELSFGQALPPARTAATHARALAEVATARGMSGEGGSIEAGVDHPAGWT